MCIRDRYLPLLAADPIILKRYERPQRERVGTALRKGVITSIGYVPVSSTHLDVYKRQLYYLASHPNRVFTRDQLLDEVWGFEYYGDSRTIDVHVKRLREKLEGASDAWGLKTVWGVGYKFEVKD